ncbi:MAG: VOC family protein [Eubacterium sp.]|nr:VOC family protein [Eubacterium sp.]
MVKINGVDHFAISVYDMEETIAWYERVFGFQVFDHSEIPGTGIKVCHMAGHGLILEVFNPPGGNTLPESRKIPDEDLKVNGNKHISFGVPDGEQAKKELIADGVEIVFEAIVDGTYGIFIHDNTGNLIEIFEEKGEWYEKISKLL